MLMAFRVTLNSRKTHKRNSSGLVRNSCNFWVTGVLSSKGLRAVPAAEATPHDADPAPDEHHASCDGKPEPGDAHVTMVIEA